MEHIWGSGDDPLFALLPCRFLLGFAEAWSLCKATWVVVAHEGLGRSRVEAFELRGSHGSATALTDRRRAGPVALRWGGSRSSRPEQGPGACPAGQGRSSWCWKPLVESLPTAPGTPPSVNYRPEYQHGWGSKTFYTQLRLDPSPGERQAFLQALLGHDGRVHTAQPLSRLVPQMLIARNAGHPFFWRTSARPADGVRAASVGGGLSV